METVELAFEELGRQPSEPIVILHGFFASTRNWRKVAEKLAKSSRVFSLDLRNHGNSPHHPEMGYPMMVADVLRFMDAQGLSLAHFIGHSMGGKVAMWLALNHPERVGKLIVVDIAPKSYEHSFDVMIQALIDLPLAQLQNRKQAETLLAPKVPELEYRQFLLQNLNMQEGGYVWRINLATFKAEAAKIVAFPEIQSLVPYLGDALFIGGSDSTYVKKGDFSGLFPCARLDLIKGAGHWLHVQQPDLFMEKVESFLQCG